MFKENFIRLCNERGESPSSVCKKVNITPATFSGWDSNSVPRQATLLRIADYFGVTVESLTADTTKTKALVFDESFTELEKELVVAYRKHPEMHEAVHKILGIEEREKKMDDIKVSFEKMNERQRGLFKNTLKIHLIKLFGDENCYSALDEYLKVNDSIKWLNFQTDERYDARIPEMLTFINKANDSFFEGMLYEIKNPIDAKSMKVRCIEGVDFPIYIERKEAFFRLGRNVNEMDELLITKVGDNNEIYLNQNVSAARSGENLSDDTGTEDDGSLL